MKPWLIGVALAVALIPPLTHGEEQLRYVKLETSKGDIVLELFAELAPETVANFIGYVDSGFYDGTIFHRSVSNFVIQGGGYTAELKKKSAGEPIVNEADNMLPNKPGTIAMARTADPHSATSQFFINVADNLALNHAGKTNSHAWGYAVFGQVVAGQAVIEAIRMSETGPRAPFASDVPLEAIVIAKASVLDGPPATPPPAADADAVAPPEAASPPDLGVRGGDS